MARLTAEEFNRFNSELASLVQSGISLPDGLRNLATHARSGPLKRFAEQVAEGLNNGKTLSEAAESSDVGLKPEYAALLRCADQSGDAKAFLRFAVQHARRVQRHRMSLLTMLSYPFMVVAAGLAILVALSIFILPKFLDIFVHFGPALPALTPLIVKASIILGGLPGILLVLAVIALLAGVLFHAAFRDRLLDMASALPTFGRMLALSDTAVFTRFLSVMLSKGVALSDALEAASLAVTLKSSKQGLLKMKQASENGHTIAKHLPPETPPTAAFVFRQAEENGDLAAGCESISEYCEDQFDMIGKRSLAILEPFLLLLIGVLIGIIIVGLYLPLFSIPKVVR